jgi:hypothetical protein
MWLVKMSWRGPRGERRVERSARPRGSKRKRKRARDMRLMVSVRRVRNISLGVGSVVRGG